MHTDPIPLGFGHFLAQSDPVARALLGLLLLMSALAWSVIAVKAASFALRRRRSRAFLAHFRSADSLDTVAAGIRARGAREPFAWLALQAVQARAHHARHGAARLAEAGTASDFVARSIRTALDEQTARLETGLSLLATVGATAPFVGLFGTVWGVYHALVAIGSSGAGTLDKVAGPVGEALIMTAIGLAVAIPAVVAYNALTRANRLLLARLDAFAHDLHTFVAMGQALGHGREAVPTPAPAASMAANVAAA